MAEILPIQRKTLSNQSINQATHVEGFEQIVLYKNIKTGQLKREHTFRPMRIPTDC